MRHQRTGLGCLCTHLSPLIRCRFLLGLAPGALSRRSAGNSLESARVKASESIPRLPVMSLALPLILALLILLFSTFRDACSLPRSDGGGGVVDLAGVREAGLLVSSTDRFVIAGGRGGGSAAAASDSNVILTKVPE